MDSFTPEHLSSCLTMQGHWTMRVMDGLFLCPTALLSD